MSKLVYIAGPYRAPTPWGVEQNIRNAMDAAVMVWRAGLWALCPHANTARMEGVTTDESFLVGYVEMMRRCDAVLLVEGWRKSQGARAEVDEAMTLGLPVLYAWGDASYCDDILRDLGRMPGGYRVPAGGQEPALDDFWLGRYVRPFTAQP